MSKKIRPSKLEAHLGYWLRYVSNHVSERFEKLLAEKHCSVTEWVALRLLFDKPETRHAELIIALSMTKSAVSKVISRLEKKKWVKRSYSQDSNRDQLLSLTATGVALVPVLALEADKNEKHFFGHLTATEHRALTQILINLVSHHQFKEKPLK